MARSCCSAVSFSGVRCLKSVVAAPVNNLLRLIITRSNSKFAGVSPQIDHDYFYYYSPEKYPDSSSTHHRLDSERSSPPRGVQWVFIGANRHVYADKLSKLLEVPHISMASLVRQDLNPGSYLYKKIANAVNQGELVSEEIIFGLLSKRLDDGYYDGETGFILDGIPRTENQAVMLDKLVEIDLVVNFKSTKDCLLQHNAANIFSHSHYTDGQDKQSEYSVLNSRRSWKGKGHSYTEQVRLLEEYYKKQKKLIDFEACDAPGETWRGLMAVLNLQHIDAAHSISATGPRLP